MFNRLSGDLLADRARDAYAESRDIARRGVEQANSFIHEQPVTATLLAVGAGLMIGMLYPRRRKVVRKSLGARTVPKSKKRARA